MLVFFLFLGGESGSADTVRDPRGFAVKFYTEEGNWDLVGNNTPIFFIRDPILVRKFLISHCKSNNPASSNNEIKWKLSEVKMLALNTLKCNSNQLARIPFFV